jgi:hypothetical protein
MKSHSTIGNAPRAVGEARLGRSPIVATPGFLNLVSPQELQQLRDSLLDGRPPRDLLQRFVEQNSRLIISLLFAAYSGEFRQANRASLERLLRVLAYVRKDEDAIPDSRPDGYVDDQQEIRAMLNEMGDLIQSFKMWRLRHQVPEMWDDS